MRNRHHFTEEWLAGKAKWDPEGPGTQVLWASNPIGLGVRLHPAGRHSWIKRIDGLPFFKFADYDKLKLKEAKAAWQDAQPPSRRRTSTKSLRAMWAAKQRFRSQATGAPKMSSKAVSEVEGYLDRYTDDWLDLPLKDITTPMVTERALLIQAGQFKSLATGRICGTHGTARQWLTWMATIWTHTEALHEIDRNPFALVGRMIGSPETEDKEKRLTDEEIHAVLNAQPGDFNNPLWIHHVRVQLLTGLRCSEVSYLRPDCIVGDELRLPKTATKAYRALALPILPALRREIEAVAMYPRTQEPLFPWRDPGLPARRIAQALGHTWTSHQLRHTWATVAEECDIPEYIIGACLNHAPTSVTRRYAKVMPEKKLDAMEKVHELLENIGADASK